MMFFDILQDLVLGEDMADLVSCPSWVAPPALGVDVPRSSELVATRVVEIR